MSRPVDVVQVVVPEGIDDPRRPSGGNLYDRRTCAELAAVGWSVREHHVPGSWPHQLPADEDALAAVLDGLPEGDRVLVDGLVASAAPQLVSRYAARLRLAVLVHLPLGVASPRYRGPERELLAAVAAVVTTSGWTRSWLLEHYGLAADRVHVAVPGTDPAELTPRSPGGGELICVGALAPTKGQDLLLDALAEITDLAWRCVCVGSLDVDPAFADEVRVRAESAGLAGRVVFTGALTRDELDAAYRQADVLVLPSRAETYGMVVTEALARGLPVVAARTGGVPEALGGDSGGPLAGLLVPPGDAHALADALRAWLETPDLRTVARRAAQDRRRGLPSWRDTGEAIRSVLSGLEAS